MRAIEHFVPGRGVEATAGLARLSKPIPPSVTSVYVEAFSDPGETVLVPYCQGLPVVREILDSGRRVLALNFDPILVLALQAVLVPIPQRQLDAAVARLGDSLKQGIPLRQYLSDLYATTCHACLRPAVADYFVWDRELNTLIAKGLHCPDCGWDGQTAVDADDRERLEAIPQQAMHYHYILDRLAPSSRDTSLRPRLEQLLRLYTQRNLYALAEMTMKIEARFADGPQSRTLKALLLECLDLCSSLNPLPTSSARQRGLSRPARFLERNVWHAFESAVGRFQAATTLTAPLLAGSLKELSDAGEEVEGYLGLGLVRELPQVVPVDSIPLILTSPPAFGSSAWSLSYLWGAWLLGSPAVSSLKPLLRQRTPDTAWYARGMSGSFKRLAGLLKQDGRLVVVLSDQRPAVTEALLHAASSTPLEVAALMQAGTDGRLELRAPRALLDGMDQPAPVVQDSLARAIQASARSAATETIEAWGQPVAWRTLHAAILSRLARDGLLAMVQNGVEEAPSHVDFVADLVQAGLEDAGLEHLAQGKKDAELWWSGTAASTEVPLFDRLEKVTHQILDDALTSLPPEPEAAGIGPGTIDEHEFSVAVYTHLPAPLAPDAELVRLCLRSYAAQVADGCWQLREEDRVAAREPERQFMIEHLVDLGERLGFRATTGRGKEEGVGEQPSGLGDCLASRAAYDTIFDVVWVDGNQVHSVFAVRWQATMGEVLAQSIPAPETVSYFVIPGGRAALVNYKLDHNPLWQQAMDEHNWRFIKYRHVRQLVAQPDVDQYALRTIIGLDPIVEKEQAQLSLF